MDKDTGRALILREETFVSWFEILLQSPASDRREPLKTKKVLGQLLVIIRAYIVPRLLMRPL